MIQHYFTAFTFASSLILEETTTNITKHILNYDSSFLWSNFSFIISKRLYYTSFKLNIVNVPRMLPPWSPKKLTERLSVPPDPQLHFISQFMQIVDFFSFLAKTLCTHFWMVATNFLLTLRADTCSPGILIGQSFNSTHMFVQGLAFGRVVLAKKVT